MCGLVGVAGDLHYEDEFTMKRLLLFDYFRGQDSTGMAAIRGDGEIKLAKIDSNPINLFEMKSFICALNGNMSRAFIGHNRAATRGKVNTANAHPFVVDHIVMAHNGTLDYMSLRRLEKELKEEFSVDSLALATGIAKLGIEKTISLCTVGKTATDGAWALTWFNQEDKTLNFLRNKHRLLYHAYEKEFRRMFWASEWWMLRETFESATNKYELYSEKKGDQNVGFFLFDEDVHYKYPLEELCKAGKKKIKPICKKVAGKEPEETVNPDPFGRGDPKTWYTPLSPKTGGTHTGNVTNLKSSTTHNSTTNSRGTHSDKKKDIIQLVGTNKYPYAHIVDEDKFLPMVTDGCAYCSRPIKFGEPGVTIYERDGRVLCRICVGYKDDAILPPVRIYVRNAVIDSLQ